MRDRLPAIVIGVVAALIVVWTCWSTLFPAKAESHPPYCQTNLKVLATGFLIYGSDYDDKYPISRWDVALDVYLKNPRYYTCPQVAERGKEWGYALNSGVKGAHILESELGAKPLFFDVDELKPGLFAPITTASTTRHDGHGWVSYGDGRVSALPSAKK